jgi:hypothetical protein
MRNIAYILSLHFLRKACNMRTMDTHLYDHPALYRAFSKRALILGLALAMLLLGRSEGQATLAVPTALSQYALLSNGSFSANNSTIEGNAWLKSGSLTSSNHNTFDKNFSYQSDSLNLNNGSNTVLGTTAKDTGLQTTINTVAQFSQNMANLTATLIENGNYSGNTTLLGNGGTNVIDFTGSSYNLNGTITLSGGANDVFYINVFSNMSLTGLLLTGGVTASNVFLNIVNGQNAQVSGTINGTVLAFNSQNQQATAVAITNATIYGDVVAGDLNNMGNSTIVGIAAAQSSVAMAPEASSMAAMSLFGIGLLASSAARLWRNNKLQLLQA